MPNVGGRLLLFLSSYFPLTLVIFFLLLNKHWKTSWGVLIGGTACFLTLLIYLKSLRTRAPIRVKVAEFKRRDGEVMSYIASYLIPFLTFSFSGWEQIVSLVIIFIVLGIIYVNSNMIQINPMLNVLGYSLYEVTLEGGSVHSLITRQRPSRGQNLSVAKIGDDILMEIRA